MSKSNTFESQPTPDDPPPPYTDTTSDAMYHYQTPQQQQQQQQTSDSSSAESSQPRRDLPNYNSQSQSTFSQRFTMQNISQRFQYKPDRGLIGNALGLAGAVVGTATNIGFGATGYDPSSSQDTSTSRREERRSARQDRRDSRRERKGLLRTGLEYVYEQATSSRSSEANTSRSAQSNSVLHIVQPSGPIQIDQDFMGEECRLETNNGPIQVLGSLSASRQINLKTANGNIVVNGQISAGEGISVSANNGTFTVNGNSIVAKHMDVTLDNGPLNFNSFIESDVIQLKTKNAPVILSHVAVGSELSVKTSNAVIELHIEDIGTDNAIINVETMNAPVNVYLPRNFAGRFSIKTSSSNQANVVAKRSESAILQYNVNEVHEKEGVCMNEGKSSNTEIRVKTMNSPATLYI